MKNLPTTNTRPIIIRTRAESVRSAMTASVEPMENAPVSPIKNLAGFILNQRKAIKAPIIAPQKAAIPKLP